MASLVAALKDFMVALFGGTIGSGESAVTSVGVIPTFFKWVTSDAVLPYFALGICVSLVLLAVKVVRGTVWGV